MHGGTGIMPVLMIFYRRSHHTLVSHKGMKYRLKMYHVMRVALHHGPSNQLRLIITVNFLIVPLSSSYSFLGEAVFNDGFLIVNTTYI